jgi:hypothetical protein
VKTIVVTCRWESQHEVEVPDDFADTGHLSDFPDSARDEMTSGAAELVDWEVRDA